MDPEDRRRIAQRGGHASHGGRGYEEDYDQRDYDRGYEEEDDDDYDYWDRPSSRYQDYGEDFDTDEDYLPAKKNRVLTKAKKVMKKLHQKDQAKN